MISEVPAVHI